MTEERRRAMAELGRLLDGIPVVMVTSVCADDFLRTRPMLLERLDDAGRLFFLTHLSSHSVREIDHDPRVNVAFVGSNPERYVSISGRGTVSRDERRIHALWNPTYRAWFRGGPDDNPLKPASTALSCSMETLPTDAAIGLLERADRLERSLITTNDEWTQQYSRSGLIFASTMN